MVNRTESRNWRLDIGATGRRIKKVVTNAGDYDKTEVYFYDGQRICQINNGSGAMVQQFIHGTQYIDELVMMPGATHTKWIKYGVP